MIKISYAEGDDIEIEGSAEDLLFFRLKLLDAVKQEKEKIIIPADVDCDPSPYDFTLRHIEIRKSSTNKFAVVNQCLVIFGNDDFLENRADNLPYDAIQPASGIAYHVHYDQISFGDFLDDDSLGAILTLRKE